MWAIYESTDGTGNDRINNRLRGFRRLEDSQVMQKNGVDHEAGSSGDWLGFCSGYVVLFIPIPNREDVGHSITTLM